MTETTISTSPMIIVVEIELDWVGSLVLDACDTFTEAVR